MPSRLGSFTRRGSLNLHPIDFFVGLIFGILGLWATFFYKQTPSLKVEIVASTPVLSIREGVEDLEIRFRGKNIEDTDQSLTLINLKLTNKGRAAIKPGDFDPNHPIVLSIPESEIVRAESLNSEGSYLYEVFSRTTPNYPKGRIEFPPFILEPSNFLTIKLLILHQDEAPPKPELMGKVADVNEIEIVNLATTTESPSPISVAIAGSWKIHLLRIVGYAFLPAFLFVLLMKLNGFARKWRKERDRRRYLEDVLAEIENYLKNVPLASRNLLRAIANRLIDDKHFRSAVLHKLPRMLRQMQSADHSATDRSIFERFDYLLEQFDTDRFLSDEMNPHRLLEMARIVAKK